MCTCIMYLHISKTFPFAKIEDVQIVTKKDTGNPLYPLPKLPLVLTSYTTTL